MKPLSSSHKAIFENSTAEKRVIILIFTIKWHKVTTTTTTLLYIFPGMNPSACSEIKLHLCLGSANVPSSSSVTVPVPCSLSLFYPEYADISTFWDIITLCFLAA
jgi:hypothetical protein